MRETWDPIKNQVVASKNDRVEVTFVIGDWQGPVGGKYYLDLTHNLNDAGRLFCDLYEGSVKTVVESYVPTNENTLRITVMAIPDMRFAGTAVINN